MEHEPSNGDRPETDGQQSVSEPVPETDPARPRTRDPGGPIGALVAWLVIIAATAFVFMLSQAAPPPEQIERIGIQPPSPLLSANAKLALVAEAQAKALGTETSEADTVLDYLPLFATSPADELRVALLKDEIDEEAGEASARETLLRLAEADAGQLGEDALTFLTVFDGATIDDETRDGLVERHGWFARLGLSRGLDDASPERAAVISAAEASYAVQAVASLGLILVAILSVMLFIAAIVLVSMRKVRARYAPGAGGSVFLETFAVFLVLFIGLQLVIELVTPVLGPWAQLLRWGCLAALIWPRLRGAPRANVKFGAGLHAGRGFFKEMALGIIGYLALLPIVGVGLAITLALIARSLVSGPTGDGEAGGGPEFAHPLPDMLGQADAIGVIILAQLAVLWAPIVEETFFRGVLYHHLRGRLGLIMSGLISGLLFASLHPQGIYGIPVLMSVAMCLSLIREWRGTIVASATAHAVHNGTITLMVLMLIAA